MPEKEQDPSDAPEAGLTLPMRLYFLRHTHALPSEDDAARPLSEKGKAQAVQVARFCQQAGVIFDAAYTSPLVRARQTAETVVAITNEKFPLKVVLSEELLNETLPSTFYKWLKGLPPARHVLMVGHNPSLTDRVRHLLCCPKAESFNLPKGGLACIRTEDRQHGVLKFFISPKIL